MFVAVMYGMKCCENSVSVYFKAEMLRNILHFLRISLHVIIKNLKEDFICFTVTFDPLCE